MKKGFDEHEEPTLEKMDDYQKSPSEEKKKTIMWVIISGLVLGVFYAMARYYFWNAGEKEYKIPKEQIIRHY